MFREEDLTNMEAPEYSIYCPVVTKAYDKRYLGASRETNNTGELTAIGELMVWLLEEAPDNGEAEVDARYDSKYAADQTRAKTTTNTNGVLVAKLQRLVRQVEEKRVLSWTHVYGHTNEHGNEIVDRLAKKGARREVGRDDPDMVGSVLDG